MPGIAAGGCWTGEVVPMTTPGTAASRCNFLLKSLRSWRPLRPASWQVLARRERAAAGRGAPIGDLSASQSRPGHVHRREVAHALPEGTLNRRLLGREDHARG